MAIQYEGQYRAQGSSTWLVLFALQNGLTYNWNTSGLAAGIWELQVRARDTATSEFSNWTATRTFNIQHAASNTAPPAPSVTVPANAQVVDTSVGVVLQTVSDPDGDPVTYRAEYRLAGGTWLPLFGLQSSPNYNWITSGLANGSYELRGYANDGQAESAAGTVRSFTITHAAVTAFLIVGGVNVDVEYGKAQGEAPFIPGADQRNIDGILRASAWGNQKRRWQFKTRPMQAAELNTLLAAASPIGFVAVGGLALGGVTLQCAVDIGGIEYMQDGLTYQRAVLLEIEEQ